MVSLKTYCVFVVAYERHVVNEIFSGEEIEYEYRQGYRDFYPPYVTAGKTENIRTYRSEEHTSELQSH